VIRSTNLLKFSYLNLNYWFNSASCLDLSSLYITSALFCSSIYRSCSLCLSYFDAIPIRFWLKLSYYRYASLRSFNSCLYVPFLSNFYMPLMSCYRIPIPGFDEDIVKIMWSYRYKSWSSASFWACSCSFWIYRWAFFY